MLIIKIEFDYQIKLNFYYIFHYLANEIKAI